MSSNPVPKKTRLARLREYEKANHELQMTVAKETAETVVTTQQQVNELKMQLAELQMKLEALEVDLRTYGPFRGGK